MTETTTKPTKPADAKPADAKPRETRGAYLPVLPDGWSYSVTAVGPDGRSAEVKPHYDKGRWWVRFHNGETREVARDSLTDALRSLVGGIRALAQVEREEAAVKAAREAALTALGEPVKSPSVEA